MREPVFLTVPSRFRQGLTTVYKTRHADVQKQWQSSVTSTLVDKMAFFYALLTFVIFHVTYTSGQAVCTARVGGMMDSASNMTTIVCQNVGSDGRSLDQLLRLSPIFDEVSNKNFNFDQLKDITYQLYVKNSKGNITINQNGLAGLRNLELLQLEAPDFKTPSYYLMISAGEFRNTPALRKYG